MCIRDRVIASHKLVKTDDGKLLYVSKNCTAGGFAAETDVTYASSPVSYTHLDVYKRQVVTPHLNVPSSGSISSMRILNSVVFARGLSLIHI